ncbi:phosphatidylinositol glycan anchor biosynthesis class O [Cotesia typhae]|uniref:phosphatidylinositol glycan anchor biosynthesis class O n=1 Tax=Cotesia typhae TaxID=2053667 RepID=UPI003D68BC13
MANKFLSSFKFIICISYLMVTGLILFLNGFFLTRMSQVERSNCTSGQNLENYNIETLLEDPERAGEVCSEFGRRVVLLVVDALKYEFLDWQDNITNPYYQNKIPAVHHLLNKYPTNSRLYKSIVDPPTTTMQRIKAITTGTLPTFIDVSSNFASEEVDEDNLIHQIGEKGVVFMGDDTWTNLFPGKYLRQFPAHSFNIRDLDTVDREVRSRIFFELQKNDWSLLIAHNLGVDHCGHKHGPNHPEMTRKLNEINELINEIISAIDNHTIFFVIGDHGMTDTGDHGGDSDNEIEAGLFIYSKSPLQNPIEGQSRKTINQIDIVPTLALILGIPIPFSNIGSLISDALPVVSKTSDVSHTLHALWRNVYQTKKYIDTYSANSFLFAEQTLQELDQHYQNLFQQVSKVNNNQEALKKFAQVAYKYLKILRDSCIEIWVQFEWDLMFKGLFLMISTLFFSYTIINQLPKNDIIETFDRLFIRIIITNCIALVIVYVLYTLQLIINFGNTFFFFSGVIFQIFLAIMVIRNWSIKLKTWNNNSKNNKLNNSVGIILILIILGLFSNSYVIEENKILSFLLITQVWLSIHFIIKKDNVNNNFNNNCDRKYRKCIINSSEIPYKHKVLLIVCGIIICLAVRLSSYYWRCREEQNRELCGSFILGKTGSITSNKLERILIMISLVSLGLYIFIVKMWLRNCGNLSGFSLNIIVARKCPVLTACLIVSYWVLERLPTYDQIKSNSEFEIKALAIIAIIIYFCIVISISILFIQPLGIFFLEQNQRTLTVYKNENVIPKVFNKVKKLFYSNRNNDDDDDDNTPIVYGLGTVYSAAFICLSVFIMLLDALLLGRFLAPSIFLMFITCTAVLVIIGMERHQNATNFTELLQIPNSAIICWFLIAEYFFYGTGHQPTFSTIQWDAALVGTHGFFYTNIVPTILIGINTFGSHILLGLTLPLLVIVPSTIIVMIPSLSKIQFRVNEELKKGELVLFDRLSTFHNSLFLVAGKYILLHGLRTFGCMLAATFLCRHLMVWKIFAPKLIFEGISFLVTLGSVIISYLMIYRIDNKIESLITGVNKIR